jgi:Dimerisation domain
MTVDPTPIVGVATGFMAAKQLFAASEHGLFEELADGPLRAEELASRTGLPLRSARILADAMVGLGLLSFDGRYHNTPATQEYLTGSGLDLRAFLRFWDTLSYPHWEAFGDATRVAEPAPFDFGGDRTDVFLTGVQTYNSLHARMLAEHYDFGAHKRVLDLGGLSPAFLTEAAARNPGLHGDFVEDPLDGAVPGKYDAVLLEHVIHRYTPEQNQAILRVAREAAEDGARLLVLDFLLDPADGRLLDPLLAGEYLVIDGTVVYPEAEIRSWLEATGWRHLETRPLPGSPRVLIAEAT